MKIQLSPQDIKSIVELGEGYHAEFKIRVPSKLKEITEEICAFANSVGGVLLIGVSDDNVIEGATIDNNKRSAILNAIHDIKPYLPVKFYSVEVENKTVWVIEVESGAQKPYVLSGAIYVRQGPNTQKLIDIDQIHSFFQNTNRIYFDETPCKDFAIKDEFDYEWFEEFKVLGKLSKSVSEKQIQNNLKLFLPDENFKMGGVLFFGKNPEKYIETASIRCLAFEGTNKTTILDDKIYHGALMKQYTQAMQWIKGKLNVRYEIDGGGPRKEHWEIPETALKEAIINALAHRDYYDKGARITIEVFPDRVEITNPGGLSNAITEAEFGTKSHSRNPLIFGLFVRINMVEQIGSGIGRIRDLITKAKLPQPQFKTEGMFTVVFIRTVEKTVEKINLSDTAKRIIELIKEQPNITTQEIAEIVGITEKGVEYNLAKLQKEDVIYREGSRKTGVWKLKN